MILDCIVLFSDCSLCRCSSITPAVRGRQTEAEKVNPTTLHFSSSRDQIKRHMHYITTNKGERCIGSVMPGRG